MNEYCTGSPYCEPDQVCRCKEYDDEQMAKNQMVQLDVINKAIHGHKHTKG